MNTIRSLSRFLLRSLHDFKDSWRDLGKILSRFLLRSLHDFKDSLRDLGKILSRFLLRSLHALKDSLRDPGGFVSIFFREGLGDENEIVRVGRNSRLVIQVDRRGNVSETLEETFRCCFSIIITHRIAAWLSKSLSSHIPRHFLKSWCKSSLLLHFWANVNSFVCFYLRKGALEYFNPWDYLTCIKIHKVSRPK